MKKRILSLVLCAAMLLSMCLFLGAGVMDDTTADGSAETTESYIPAVNFTNVAPFVQANAQAANGPARAAMFAANANGGSSSADNGVVTSKTATANKDGTYTITLEAYATGSKVITEIQKDVPTDIVLVLDQSGSMDDPMGTVTYKPYTGGYSTNAANYDRRHNGGSANLWHKLSDDSYVPVNVEKTQAYTALNADLKNYTTNRRGQLTSDCYYYYKDALYEKVGDEYKKVTVTRTSGGGGRYTYTYTFSDGDEIPSIGNDSVPNFGSHGPLYTLAADGNNTVYTYTYTDAGGATKTISTSTGASTKYAQFYERLVSSSGGGKRLDALKSAATEFAESVATKAAGKDGQLGTDDDIDHRIAVVGFASESGYGNNSELLSISGSNSGSVGVAYSDIEEKHLNDVLQSMNTGDGQKMVTSAINALEARGATRTDLGMDMAQRILSANPVPAGQKRNRVVVVFTDGSPTDANGFQTTVAENAIATANGIKSGGATVYGIGIFAGADATSPGTKPTSDLNQYSSALPAACNWFMQNLSSNNGKVQNPSYYLSAADAKSLKNIFKQISDQIENGGSSTTLSSDAVVKDVISPQFQLPKGAAAKDIQLETYACTGKTGDTYTWSKNNGTMGATATVENDTVSVTGFDFAGNWCGMETQTDGSEVLHSGNKLVISFKVEPKDGFLGGNDVLTNDNAAIYDKSTATEPVRTFDDKPQVNVPIKDVTVTATDKNVYLLGSLTADELKADATVKVGDVTLDLAKANDAVCPYGLEKWQTDYVNITVTIQDADGKVISDTGLSDLTNDVKYTIKVEVAPKTPVPLSHEGTLAEAQTVTEFANVNVFKPELTYKDSEVYYGDTAPDFDSNLTNTVWKHGDTVADNTIPMGEAPELTLAFTPDTGAIEGGKINTRQDIDVAVTVKSGDQDVTNATTFLHTNCAGKTCTLPDGKAFLLHVNTCSLTISKTVTGQNNGQSFVFTVKDANGNVITTVAVKGGASKTITGLPIGTYTVTEDTQWSWQYNLTSGNDVTKELKANAAEDYAAADFTNEYKGTNWLTSIVDVINKWVSATQIQQIPDPKTN